MSSTSPGDIIPPAEEHDQKNAELGFRFVRALAVEKAALDSRLKPAAVRVLAAISFFMNNQVRRAWPSYARIAELTGYSPTSIEGAIRDLKAAGYVFTERKAPITGGRALVHYGLCSIEPSDIGEMVAAAVAELRRQQADPTKNSWVKPTQDKTNGSPPDPAVFGASDPAVLATQKPLFDEPLDCKMDGFRDDFAKMYFGWGASPPTTITTTMRDEADRALAREVATLPHGANQTDIAARALAATINTLVTTAPKAKGATAFLRLFRHILNQEAGKLAVCDASTRAHASIERDRAEKRVVTSTSLGPRGHRPSAHALAAEIIGEV